MNEFRWESWAIILASIVSLVYIWHPGPYPMGAFTFIAQPLFVVAMGSYAVKVIRELRRSGAL
jgi:hypothetical protein